MYIDCLAIFAQDSRLITIGVPPRNLRITPSARRAESIQKPHKKRQGSVRMVPQPRPPCNAESVVGARYLCLFSMHLLHRS